MNLEYERKESLKRQAEKWIADRAVMLATKSGPGDGPVELVQVAMELWPDTDIERTTAVIHRVLDNRKEQEMARGGATTKTDPAVKAPVVARIKELVEANPDIMPVPCYEASEAEKAGVKITTFKNWFVAIRAGIRSERRIEPPKGKGGGNPYVGKKAKEKAEEKKTALLEAVGGGEEPPFIDDAGKCSLCETTSVCEHFPGRGFLVDPWCEVNKADYESGTKKGQWVCACGSTGPASRRRWRHRDGENLFDPNWTEPERDPLPEPTPDQLEDRKAVLGDALAKDLNEEMIAKATAGDGDLLDKFEEGGRHCPVDERGFCTVSAEEWLVSEKVVEGDPKTIMIAHCPCGAMGPSAIMHSGIHKPGSIIERSLGNMEGEGEAALPTGEYSPTPEEEAGAKEALEETKDTGLLGMVLDTPVDGLDGVNDKEALLGREEGSAEKRARPTWTDPIELGPVDDALLRAKMREAAVTKLPEGDLDEKEMTLKRLHLLLDKEPGVSCMKAYLVCVTESGRPHIPKTRFSNWFNAALKELPDPHPAVLLEIRNDHGQIIFRREREDVGGATFLKIEAVDMKGFFALNDLLAANLMKGLTRA